MDELSKDMVKFIISYYGDMPKLLERAGTEMRLNSNIFCPFHAHNYHTPSAHLYKDDYGWLLWCFAEHKMYSSYDVYTKLLNIDPSPIAQAVWNRITPEQRKELESLSGNERDLKELPFADKLNNFKHSEISYDRLLDNILSSINELEEE